MQSYRRNRDHNHKTGRSVERIGKGEGSVLDNGESSSTCSRSKFITELREIVPIDSTKRNRLSIGHLFVVGINYAQSIKDYHE